MSTSQGEGWRGYDYSSLEVETLERCEHLIGFVVTGDDQKYMQEILERGDSGVGPTVPEIYRVRTLFESA